MCQFRDVALYIRVPAQLHRNVSTVALYLPAMGGGAQADVLMVVPRVEVLALPDVVDATAVDWLLLVADAVVAD